jgi:hypothetical protein
LIATLDCDAFGSLCYDMALTSKPPKTPLWLYAVAIAVGFAIGVAVAYWLVR